MTLSGSDTQESERPQSRSRSGCGFTGSVPECTDVLLDLSEQTCLPELLQNVLRINTEETPVTSILAPWDYFKTGEKNESEPTPRKAIPAKSLSLNGSRTIHTSQRLLSNSRSRGNYDTMRSDFDFRHSQDASSYIQDYRRHHTADHVTRESHVVLGYDVPDPYMERVKFNYRQLMAASPVTSVHISQHSVHQSLSSRLAHYGSCTPSTRPHSARPPEDSPTTATTAASPSSRADTPELDVNLCPQLQREKSFSVSNLHFPAHSVRKKTFTPTSHSYLNLAFPKSLHPAAPIQVLVETCPKGAVGHLPTPRGRYPPREARYRCPAAVQRRHGRGCRARGKQEGVRSLGKVAAASEGMGVGVGEWAHPVQQARDRQLAAAASRGSRQGDMQWPLVNCGTNAQ